MKPINTLKEALNEIQGLKLTPDEKLGLILILTSYDWMLSVGIEVETNYNNLIDTYLRKIDFY